MASLAFTVAPIRDGWAVSHGGLPMATFDTREEAERAALAIAVKHPSDKTAQVDLEGGDQPASTVLVF